MNTTIRALRLAAALAAALLPAAAGAGEEPAAPAPTPSEVDFEATFGGQWRNDLSGLGEGRFLRQRDVTEGFLFESARFQWAPAGKDWTLSATALDAFQKDQRYFLELLDPTRFSLRLRHRESPNTYSRAAVTLWSGAGTGQLTIPNLLRQGLEDAAGLPTNPTAAPGIAAVVNDVLANGGRPVDLGVQRRQSRADLSWTLRKGLDLKLAGSYEDRQGTRPLGFGTYIRRQGLTGIPGTGTGFFWRETVEPRGVELVEPVDYRIPELDASLSWSRAGRSAVVGWHGSFFRNDTSAIYFDNPFEGAPGRASASTFSAAADQEPPAPGGNNNFRGLFSRSVMQLAPSNTFQQLYANGSLKLGTKSRLSAAASYGRTTQDEPFLPYAENDQVVASGTAGQPGVVLARDLALPRPSLDGRIDTLRADVRFTTRPLDALALRAAYRYYDYDDKSAEIFFPGYSSSGDSFFRRAIGQKDEAGNKILVNETGSYTRQRLQAGAAWTRGAVTLDGEYTGTFWDYTARQVDGTGEHALKGTLRWTSAKGRQVAARYLRASRSFDGRYDVGLEASGVRAFDVWNRDRDQAGLEVDLPLRDSLSLNLGGEWTRDEYPDAVEGFTQPYGLQDSSARSVFAGLNWHGARWDASAQAGYQDSDWNSLQVTKTSQGSDYNPVNRWTREAADHVFWVGGELTGRLSDKKRLGARLDYQKFSGDWETTNLGTPDVNSAVAYPFPDTSDSLLTAQLSLVWSLNPNVDFEARYWFEPYRLDDFTWNQLQPYMQGVLQETQGSASAVAAANVSRLLWLNARYDDYDAQVVSALLRFRF